MTFGLLTFSDACATCARRPRAASPTASPFADLCRLQRWRQDLALRAAGGRMTSGRRGGRHRACGWPSTSTAWRLTCVTLPYMCGGVGSAGWLANWSPSVGWWGWPHCLQHIDCVARTDLPQPAAACHDQVRAAAARRAARSGAAPGHRAVATQPASRQVAAPASPAVPSSCRPAEPPLPCFPAHPLAHVLLMPGTDARGH